MCTAWASVLLLAGAGCSLRAAVLCRSADGVSAARTVDACVTLAPREFVPARIDTSAPDVARVLLALREWFASPRIERELARIARAHGGSVADALRTRRLAAVLDVESDDTDSLGPNTWYVPLDTLPDVELYLLVDADLGAVEWGPR